MGCLDWINDETYLKIAFYCKFGKKLDLINPRKFNEKIQWLKLYDRNPQYIVMADKYNVKFHVADLIGKEYVVPLYGVWNHFDEIDFEKLPEKFVLKCTHDSAGLVIVKDKSTLNKRAAKKKIERCLARNFYRGGENGFIKILSRVLLQRNIWRVNLLQI